MEFYVVYNGSPVFSGNQDDLDRYFNNLLRHLNCPVDYYTLDNFITTEHAYIYEKVEGIEQEEYICGNTGISKETYNEIFDWLNSKAYKEFTNHNVCVEPF